jgi:hypothetical protein
MARKSEWDLLTSWSLVIQPDSAQCGSTGSRPDWSGSCFAPTLSLCNPRYIRAALGRFTCAFKFSDLQVFEDEHRWPLSRISDSVHLELIVSATMGGIGNRGFGLRNHPGIRAALG